MFLVYVLDYWASRVSRIFWSLVVTRVPLSVKVQFYYVYHKFISPKCNSIL